ncbi:hypothetical protein KA078_03060 [Candidatus Woesebacteria bacterium]|nr:hypothetical protein [Candidatus Woesebacteria bacterium]
MQQLPEIPHFYPFVDLQPVTLQSAQLITNVNERHFAEIVSRVPTDILVAYHEPGKVIPPVEYKKNCRAYTIPDFLVLAGFDAYLIEIGAQPRTTAGKLKSGKAAQRRTLATTGLPVGIIGTSELLQLEEIFYSGFSHAFLHLLASFTRN